MRENRERITKEVFVSTASSSLREFSSVISNMASVKDTTAAFFCHGNARQYDYVLKLYPQVLKMKSEEKKKPDELIKLDEW